MIPIRIAVLEDNPIEMLTVKMMLTETDTGKYEYQLMGMFETLDSLLTFLQTTAVDIILSDIFAKNRPMGLELLKKQIIAHIPVILMTNSLEKAVFFDAQQLRSVHYLIKPFHAFTLQSTIESVFEEFQKQKQYDFFAHKFLYISGKGGQREQVLFEEIVYLESEGNYCFINTEGKRYVMKKSLIQLLTDELDSRFIRVHQRYAVNTKHIRVLRTDELHLTGSIELPLGKTFQKFVREFVKIG